MGGKSYAYNDGHLEEVFGDADYLHKVKMGTDGKDSPFGVFAKAECLQFFPYGIRMRHPLSDIQVSVLVGKLGMRTDGKSVEGVSDEELLSDSLPKQAMDSADVVIALTKEAPMPKAVEKGNADAKNNRKQETMER